MMAYGVACALCRLRGLGDGDWRLAYRANVGVLEEDGVICLSAVSMHVTGRWTGVIEFTGMMCLCSLLGADVDFLPVPRSPVELVFPNLTQSRRVRNEGSD